MKRKLSTFLEIRLFALVFFNVITVLIPSHAFPCSTYMLSRDRKVYFRTSSHPGIYYFDLDSFDFSPGAPSLVFENMDVELHGERNISNRFVPFTSDLDCRIIDGFLRNLIRFVAKTDDPDRMDQYLRDNYGIGADQYIERALKISELIRPD